MFAAVTARILLQRHHLNSRIAHASGKTLAVRLRDSFGDPLAGKVIRAYSYDPRSGVAVRLEDYTKSETGARSPAPRYTPPSSGPGNDWVLVLEDASKNFPVPGAKRQ